MFRKEFAIFTTQQTRVKPFYRFITVITMCLCLAFLTGINFVLYPAGEEPVKISNTQMPEEETVPSGPVEEKAPEKSSSTSIIEEFLHAPHEIELSLFNQSLLHKIHTAEKLQIVHFELLSPPPESLI